MGQRGFAKVHTMMAGAALVGMLGWSGGVWADASGTGGGTTGSGRTSSDGTSVTAATYADDWTVEVRKLLESFDLSAPTKDQLQQAEVEGMVDSLHDPYTEYFTPEQGQQLMNAINEDMPALGIMLGKDQEGVYVSQVEPGSPAEQAGLVAEDRIDAVDGQAVTADNAPELLGKPKAVGDKLTLRLTRDGHSFERIIAVAQVKFNPVRSLLFPGGIGYIQLTQFTQDADNDFSKQLAALQKQGLHSLVLDLRGNGGGYLTTAQKIMAHFIDKGLLARTKSRDGDGQITVDGGTVADYPIFCLVDDNTASAAEMLAGALRDDKKATLIGQRTFGKGVAQQILPLLSGKGYLKVTTMEYLTPNGHSVNKIGLMPDIAADGGWEGLLRALRLAGAPSLTLELDQEQVRLNGAAVPQHLSSYRDGDRLYVPIRVLAGMIGADVQWDAADQTVNLLVNGQSFTFSDNELVFREGTHYEDVTAFAARFAQLTVTTEASGAVRLKVGP